MMKDVPEVRLIRSIIEKAFVDALSEANGQNKVAAVDFLVNEDNIMLKLYLNLIGVDEIQFREKAVKILHANIDNFCSEDKKKMGSDIFLSNLSQLQKTKPSEKHRKLALQNMFRHYINSSIDFAMSSGN